MSRPHANAFSVDEDESLLICQTYTVERAFLERKKSLSTLSTGCTIDEFMMRIINH